MDPASAIAASKSLADAGFPAFLILCIAALVWALRWAILKWDAEKTARIEDAREYASVLVKANELMKELGDFVKHSKSAALAEKMLQLRQQDWDA